ncbi:hypothetical protein PVAG01_07670 [Phlyctema vagabunda]|uniref:Uncharacterized protein n=1 Tax=Phlyctema vagabunda TaxID=108571 RepID=A0ABR4PD32_9HELO
MSRLPPLSQDQIDEVNRLRDRLRREGVPPSSRAGRVDVFNLGEGTARYASNAGHPLGDDEGEVYVMRTVTSADPMAAPLENLPENPMEEFHTRKAIAKPEAKADPMEDPLEEPLEDPLENAMETKAETGENLKPM